MCRGTDPEAGLTVLCSGLFDRRCCSVTRARANAINCVFNFQFVLPSFGKLECWSVGALECRCDGVPSRSPPPVVLAGRQLSPSVAVTSGRRSPGAIVFNGARPI